MDSPKRLARFIAEGHGFFRGFFLVPFQGLNAGGEPGRALAEVVHVDPGLLQCVSHLVEPLGLPVQRSRGLVDLLLLGEQLILQVGGELSRLLDLFLDILVLLLQQLQALARGLDCGLLLLIGGDVRLGLGEGLYLLLHGRDFFLGSPEGLAVTASQLGVQLE